MVSNTGTINYIIIANYIYRRKIIIHYNGITKINKRAESSVVNLIKIKFEEIKHAKQAISTYLTVVCSIKARFRTHFTFNPYKRES